LINFIFFKYFLKSNWLRQSIQGQEGEIEDAGLQKNSAVLTQFFGRFLEDHPKEEDIEKHAQQAANRRIPPVNLGN
jgi:hypothetical protein